VSPGGGYERPAVAGSGTIACGLAASVSAVGEVLLIARSEESAERAQASVDKICGKLEGASPERIRATTDEGEAADRDLVVEAIVEDAGAKGDLLARLGAIAVAADLATTTSSLGVAALGARAGHANRLFGLHVFNPVPKMELVELCLPDVLDDAVAERARAWCQRLGKRPVEVPDQAGFVVNRLLFPYLFDAVRMLERTGLSPEAVDECMTLGAGHPMGPLQLLDFVGLDVAAAIGRALARESGEDAHAPPAELERLIAEDRLGRKSGAGFYEYGE
jgi:3-hydroxybutyryl-CoA dehydrogenase